MRNTAYILAILSLTWLLSACGEKVQEDAKPTVPQKTIVKKAQEVAQPSAPQEKTVKKDKETTARTPEATDVHAAFTLPRKTYYIGEPIIVGLVVVNRGQESICFVEPRISTPYWGNASCFIAVDENGRKVPSLLKPRPKRESPSGIPRGFDLSGLRSYITLRAGETWSTKACINRWLAFTNEGNYTLTCSCWVGVYEGAESMQDTKGKSLRSLKVETLLKFEVKRDDTALREKFRKLVERLKTGDWKNVNDVIGQYSKICSKPVFEEFEKLATTQDNWQPFGVNCIRRYGKEKASNALITAVKSGDYRARVPALHAIVDMGIDGAVSYVRKALASKDSHEQCTAILICGQHKYSECYPVLLQLDKGRGWPRQQALAGALAAYGDERGMPVLLGILKRENTHIMARIAAARALGKLGNTDGVSVLIEELENEHDEFPHKSILSALHEITGIPYRGNADWWFRWWVEEGEKKYGKE
jgi:hypothetical protein